MPARVESVVDGRRARSERGRIAVTNAMVDLVFEGYSPPTAEQVAERAGVSVASLYRYFETLEELRRETSNTYFDRYAHLFEIAHTGEGTLEERIVNYVAGRVTLYATTEPMCHLVRTRAREHPELGELIRRSRAAHADQIRQHFDVEMAVLPPAIRDDLVAAVAALTSFESWDQIRHDHNRTAHQTRRAWTAALSRLLLPVGPPPESRRSSRWAPTVRRRRQ